MGLSHFDFKEYYFKIDNIGEHRKALAESPSSRKFVKFRCRSCFTHLHWNLYEIARRTNFSRKRNCLEKDSRPVKPLLDFSFFFHHDSAFSALEILIQICEKQRLEERQTELCEIAKSRRLFSLCKVFEKIADDLFLSKPFSE